MTSQEALIDIGLMGKMNVGIETFEIDTVNLLINNTGLILFNALCLVLVNALSD